MTKDAISKLLAQYNLPVDYTIQTLPKTTSGNDSYVIETSQGKYVLRHLVRQSKSSAEQEYKIQECLSRHGITTPMYIRNSDGNLVSQFDGEFGVLSEFINGSRQKVDSLELAYNMGHTLAHIHKNLGDMPISFNREQWFNPQNADHQLSMYNGPEKDFILQHTKNLYCVFDLNLPQAVIHGDFHTNNIFSENDRVTVIFDFESAEHTVRILDIARTYLTYIKVTNLTPSLVLDKIISGYDSTATHKLTLEEHENLINSFIYVALISSVSIHNHGNEYSSIKYLEIAKKLINRMGLD